MKKKLPTLIEGQVYTFHILKNEGNGKEVERETVVHKKQMRLIKCYKYHALFENVTGKAKIRRCYQYWTLARLLSQKDGMAI